MKAKPMSIGVLADAVIFVPLFHEDRIHLD